MRAQHLITLSICLSLATGCALQHAQQLARREQAFSDHAQQVGYQQAFVDFFSRDGIALQPDPIVVHQSNAPTSRNQHQLEWKPAFVFTSSQGEIGFTSGPWQLRDAQHQLLAQGYFCSSWRYIDGQWQVVIDGGDATSRAWSFANILLRESEAQPAQNDIARDFNAFSLAAISQDAIWQLPQRDTVKSQQTPAELQNASSLKVVRENIAQTRDAATVLYQWQTNTQTLYLHTVWFAHQSQWQLQMACLSRSSTQEKESN